MEGIKGNTKHRPLSIALWFLLISSVDGAPSTQWPSTSGEKVDPDLESPCLWSDCDAEKGRWLQVPGFKFISYMIQVQECNEFNDSLDGSSETRKETEYALTHVPRLSRIHVCENIYEDTDLFVGLEVDIDDITSRRLTGLLLHVKPNGFDAITSPVCHRLTFKVNEQGQGQGNGSRTHQSGTDQIANIPYGCLATTIYEGEFTVTVQPLPWLHPSVKYDAVWQFYAAYDVQPQDIIWDKQVVALAPFPPTNQLFLVFQATLPRPNGDRLRLELSNDETPVGIDEVAVTQSSHTFDHVTIGAYRVRIRPLSAVCQVKPEVCEMAESPEVLFYGGNKMDVTVNDVAVATILSNDTGDREKDGGLDPNWQMKLTAVAAIVVLGLVAIVICVALVTCQWRRARVVDPKLHLVSPRLSPMERKAVQYLATALANSLGIAVTFTCRELPDPSRDGFSDRLDPGQLLFLTVRPNNQGPHWLDTHDEQHTEDEQKHSQRDILAQTHSEHDILALVSFSSHPEHGDFADTRSLLFGDGFPTRSPFPPTCSRNNVSIHSSHSSSGISEDRQTLPLGLDGIVAELQSRYAKISEERIIYIRYSEQQSPTPSPPKLFYSVSQSTSNSDWDTLDGGDSEKQLTAPLRPSSSSPRSKGKKTSSGLLWVCHRNKRLDRVDIPKKPLSRRSFSFPHQTRELCSHLKNTVTRRNPWHKFSSSERDVHQDILWSMAERSVKSVLESRPLSPSELDSKRDLDAAKHSAKKAFESRPLSSSDLSSEWDAEDLPSRKCVTIDRVSQCGPETIDDADSPTDDMNHFKQKLYLDNGLEIHPPRVSAPKSDCSFHWQTECDSFSNFSEMRRDLLS